MKARYYAVAFILFILSNAASAQSYFVRVTNNTNLRASYSLESAVLTSARAGATLEVVGQHNRWLRVRHEGRQFWMAAWVSHSRVDAQPTATATDIDNCCFVDRQCQSDQEWTDGYWAYQNKQCAAPATTSTVSTVSPPPGATAASDVDNCCFMNRHCRTNQQWVDGYWAYQRNECPTQLDSTSVSRLPRPAIHGSQFFVQRMNNTLDMLRDRAPEWYHYVVSVTESIREDTGDKNNGCPYRGRAWVRASEPIIWFESCKAVTRYTDFTALYWVAYALLHEACHLHAYRQNVPFATQQDEEYACSYPGHILEYTIDPTGTLLPFVWIQEELDARRYHYCAFWQSEYC